VAPRWSYRFFQFVFVVILLVAVGYLTRSWWLRGISHALMHEDAPVKAEIAVVLAGDPWGARIEKAGDLVREGYVPAALVSGPPGAYDLHECDLAIAFAVRHGYPAAWFVPFPNEARSTQDEATAVIAELQRRHMHRILLVTSEYHTARAYRTFESTARKQGYAIDIHTIGAADREFHPDSWWQSRQGEKITLLEWTKTVADALGF
jgi:uncharacterized SAM-binding protein YcdF (DUF218 family)